MAMEVDPPPLSAPPPPPPTMPQSLTEWERIPSAWQRRQRCQNGHNEKKRETWEEGVGEQGGGGKRGERVGWEEGGGGGVWLDI